MSYLDETKVNFLRRKAKFIENHLEDPSYVGFHINFLFNEHFKSIFDDLVPGGLLYMDSYFNADDWINPNKEDLRNTIISTSTHSALSYLTNLEKKEIFNKYSKTDPLRTMIRELLYVQHKTPWFFQSLNGLNSAYTINHDGFRTPDGKITISTLESIDRRISYIIDAYRQVAWDNKSMTWILPENLRKFQMEIIVTEFNTIHTKDQMYLQSKESFNQTMRFLENQFPGAYNFLTNTNKRIKSVQDILSNLSSGDFAEVYASLFILDYFKDVTVQIFQLGGCEFDVLGDFSHSYLDSINMNTQGEPLTNELRIKFNRANVITNYSLLDYIFSDDGKEINENSRLAKLEEVYNRNRDKMADDLVIKRTKDIAKAILMGDFNPFAAAKNTISGVNTNILNAGKDIL